jgi:transcriptional regulator with XRE-family HTH domain
VKKVKEFGERLKELRESLGFSQMGLSDELKLAHLIISTYELDKKEPSISHLLLFADYFQVSIDYLLGRDACQFATDLQKPLSEFLEKYCFYLDGEPATKAEIIDAIAFIKAKRLIDPS